MKVKTRLANHGFTLIELIIVIVMLGILSTFTFGFISWGARYYLDVSERQLVLDDSRFIIERLTRELRTALPYSVRTLTDNDEYACIEYVPIVASGRYIDIPQNPADSDDITVSVISPTSGSLAAGNQFSVFTTSANEVYDSSNNQTFTIDSVSAIALDSSQTVSFSSAISFDDISPAQRYYIWSTPVSYCLELNSDKYDIYRYQSYAATTNQLTPTQLKAASNISYALMAKNVSNSLATETPFHVNDNSSLIRHAQIAIYLEFSRLTDDNENMFFHHLVQVPNAP